MSKVIYAIKMFMFRDQLELSPTEVVALEQFTLFATLIYMKHWFLCPISIAAPASDLALLQKLSKYTAINPIVANAGIKAMKRHLWYLSENLVGLALFDPEVSAGTKAAMVKSFEKPAGALVKRLNGQNLADIADLRLEHFASSRSLDLFTRLEFDISFLRDDPILWPGKPSFQLALKCAQALKVVNDVAERGVALMSDYSQILTHDETQRQAILQVVEQCRNLLKDTSISQL